ncbi:hypothetical protein B0T24DRAFT_616764 [Lasiosphaeria ovina]|uniref:Uncharacterized protein n=1 Tax=Lasiosphaeria ovina TaxID=92902 RepID=A0AAE0KFC4_9PEZI|nr:hypothetical protein B0T24DRAFT_616764 [Lasiosphaeria ovina]
MAKKFPILQATTPEGVAIDIIECSKPRVKRILKGNNAVQKLLASLPAKDIQAYRGRVKPKKTCKRPSYYNAVLIQSRGTLGQPCDWCASKPNNGPFLDCRSASGFFGGSCANCKWRDRASKCSHVEPKKAKVDETSAVDKDKE